MKSSYKFDSQLFPIDVVPNSQGSSYRITSGEHTVDVEVLEAKGGKLVLLVDGTRRIVYVSSDAAKRWVTIDGQTFVLTKASSGRRSGTGHHAAGELTAPMPGQVRAVNVREGDRVTKGQTLLLLEAMKMEIRVQAPKDGEVKTLFVQPGQTVERDQMLIEMAE